MNMYAKCVCVCVCVCVRARARACVRACVWVDGWCVGVGGGERWGGAVGGGYYLSPSSPCLRTTSSRSAVS